MDKLTNFDLCFLLVLKFDRRAIWPMANFKDGKEAVSKTTIPYSSKLFRVLFAHS